MPRVLVLLFVLALVGCKSKATAPAAGTVAAATGVVERGPNGGAFVAAPVGTQLFLGDLVRTGENSTAELALAGGGTITLEPYTTVVLRARDGKLQLEVGTGAALLDGAGTYALEMGQVRLVDGRVRIAARAGQPSLELVLGQGVLLADGNPEQSLEMGQVVLLEAGKVTLVVPDAGVPDAAVVVDAAVDAPPPAPPGLGVEITGAGAKVQLPDAKKPTPLAAGTAQLVAGSRLVLDGKTTATVTADGAVLTLAGGSRLAVGENLALRLETGKVVVATDAGKNVDVAVPGGTVSAVTTDAAGAETAIDIDARGDARVTALTGDAKLTGKRGTSVLDLAAGASGVVRKKGTVEPGDTVIPKYFDHELTVGALPALTIHDAAGATAVRFAFAGKCPGTGAIELDNHPGFRSPRITAGKEAANLLVRAGSWHYRLRCGGAGAAVASGRVVVLRDRGTRRLPDDPPRFPIDADGRTYRVSYQSRIPDVQIKAKGTGSNYELHFVAPGGKEQVTKNTTGTFVIAGTSLKEQQYSFFVNIDGKKSKVSTLIIGFDQTAAQVYIEAPIDGRPWPSQVDVRGATLPGWTAQIAGTPVPSDPNTRRFHASIPPPTDARAIAIQLSHPQRGVHVYLRRGAK